MPHQFSKFDVSLIDATTMKLLKKIHNTKVIKTMTEYTINDIDFKIRLDTYVDDIIEIWKRYIYVINNTDNNTDNNTITDTNTVTNTDHKLDFKKTKKYMDSEIRKLDKKYKFSKKIRNSKLIETLRNRFIADLIPVQTLYNLIELLSTKNRHHSGVLEIAIMTGPGEFSCKYDCYYCPNQPGIARSYIKEEPAVRRAAQNDFDCVRQINTRITSYQAIGQPGDKGEFIILGGTFSNYNDEYRYTFMRDLYYACNTYYDELKRPRFSLEKEKNINSTEALFKVIGLTVETRPDCITPEEIKRYISYGVTRVQIGVQHTDDRLLKKINRGCYTIDTIRAMKLLKNAGFKVLCHYMPNLPGSTPDKDIEMFNNVIFDQRLICDEWKIYPTSVTTTSSKDIEDVVTVIEKWYNQGKYKPYDFEQLVEVVRYAKINIPKYIRISRIFRDIPVDNIIGGADIPHMRQVVQKRMAEDGEFCQCIRCREIKNRDITLDRIRYEIDKYTAQDGMEYFISANYYPPKSEIENLSDTEQSRIESVRSYIVGFCRLRIPDNPNTYKNDSSSTLINQPHYLPVLENAALVRELHIYGKMVPSYLSKLLKSNTQHRGIGTTLMKLAEQTAKENGKSKIVVISGVGVRGFYQNKLGYTLEDNYMVKHISLSHNKYMPLFDPSITFIYEMGLIMYIMFVIVYYML